MFDLKGIIPPIVTPLNEKEELDERGLKNIIEHVIKGGVHGVFALGSTGEFYALTLLQKRRVMELTVEYTQGRVPVYIGASAITTRDCILEIKAAKRAGAQAVSVLTPMFVSPSENELFDHFKTLAEAEDIPIILYNNPDRTGVNLSAGVVEKLSLLDNIVGIKDSSGDMTLTSEYIRRSRGNSFKVFAGRDTLILSVLTYGGYGAVAATANVVPGLVVSIYEKFMAGDLNGALEAQYALAPLRIAFGLGTFPSVTKEAISILGIASGSAIKPVGALSSENRKKLEKIVLDTVSYESTL